MTVNKITIAVATHKPYRMPGGSIYLPVVAGHALRRNETFPSDYVFDDSGDNISARNRGYSELTVLYWAVKNLDSEYLGLVHYRRLFGTKKKGAVSAAELEGILVPDVIVVPRKRRYFIETLKSHYGHTHNPLHLSKTYEMIDRYHPDYLEAYTCVLDRTWGYMFNMTIMSKENLSSYCSWLFDVLGHLEEVLPNETGLYNERLYGRVSEILFNCWLEKNKDSFRLKEIAYFETERVHWLRKGTSFLKAKFLGKKYEKSF